MEVVYLLLLITFVRFSNETELSISNQRPLPPCEDHQHLFLTPGVLGTGTDNRVCISRLGNSTAGTAYMQVVLKTDENEIVTRATRELPPGNGGCIDVTIPANQTYQSKATIHVLMSYPASKCEWKQHLNVRILGTAVLLVQTDRPRYRPGDTVRLRVLQLHSDFTPKNQSIESIWLESPDGVRTVFWTKQRTRMGLAQVHCKLEEHIVSGTWRAIAQGQDGSQGSVEFSVGEYQLPSFLLSVKHEARVLRTSDRLLWTVCVRYPWGEAVEGILVIRLRGAGGGVRTALRVKTPRICHRHAVAARRVGLNGPQKPDVIVADFSFQEGGTLMWQNTTVVSQVIDQAVTLEFATKHRSAIAPGLPYKLKLKATRLDATPAVDVKVKICRFPSNDTIVEPEANDKTNVCHNATTDVSGNVQISFTTANNDVFKYFRFQASLLDNSSVSTVLHLSVIRTGVSHAAFGPLVQDARFPDKRTPIFLYLNLPTNTLPVTVHYAVIVRGGAIYRWGAVTQCPVLTNSKYQSYLYDGKCHVTNIKAPESDNLLHESVEKIENLQHITLPIQLNPRMCPDSHLIAYFYYEGELVSASKHFEVTECFTNKVLAKWSSTRVNPGASVSLHISTSGPALCAISAFDTSGGVHQTTRNSLISSLKRVVRANRNLTTYDTMNECYSGSESEKYSPSDWLKAKVEASFAESGMRVASELLSGGMPCAPAPLVHAEEAKHVPRSYFPEAWLWRLASVNSNGTTSITTHAPHAITLYETGAFCLTTTGVGVASPVILQVFRKFFLHTDVPKIWRRGDTSFLQYRLFNYVYEHLPVEIEVTSDSGTDILSDSVQHFCLKPRSSVSHRVKIRAHTVGTSRVHVRARTLDDAQSLCVNVTQSADNHNISDEVILQIKVEHEGIASEENRAVVLCGDTILQRHPFASMTWSEVPAVAGTETWRITIFTKTNAPFLTNAEDLISLPQGCGEQNMAKMAINLLALQQLDPSSAGTAIAKNHVGSGFSRQIKFSHPSGGFSAFGASDGTPSTWLTAFTLRYLLKAHKILAPTAPTPDVISKAEAWLLQQQMENGCFRNVGQVFHREFQGGLNEDNDLANIALTAYVVASLLEGGFQVPPRHLQESLSCLRALHSLTLDKYPKDAHETVYTQVLVAYAITKLNSYENGLKLKNGVGFLKNGKTNAGASLEEERYKELTELMTGRKMEDNLYLWWDTGSLPTSIEATGYALLALCSCPERLRDSCLTYARPATTWLSSNRNPNGGFISTQDTLVGLEGLIAWANHTFWKQGRLRVRAKTTLNEVGVFAFESAPMSLDVPPASDHLNITVEGTGCALIQATRAFNTLSPGDATDSSEKALKVQVSVQTEGAFDCNQDNSTCFCAVIIKACAVWSDVFPNMALMEVWLPGAFRADASKLYSRLGNKNSLLRRIETRSHMSRVTYYLGTRDGSMTAKAGHECFDLHAVGPKARTGPAHAHIINYYKTDFNDTQLYTIPEECPSRIRTAKKFDVNINNLYNKALIDEDNETYEHDLDDIQWEESETTDKEQNKPYVNTTQHKDTVTKKYNTTIQDINNTRIVGGNDVIRDSRTGRLHNNNITGKKPTIRNNVTISETQTIDENTVTASTVETKHGHRVTILTRITNENKSTESTTKEYENEITGKMIGSENKDKESATKRLDEKITKPTIETLDKNMKESTTVKDNEITILTLGVTDQNTGTMSTVGVDHKQNKIREVTKTENIDIVKDSDGSTQWNNFYVINTETDLEVPPGIEGPIPAVVLPPQPLGALYKRRNQEKFDMTSRRYGMLHRYPTTNYYYHPVRVIPAY